jgi:DNA-binding response OmpR family regulator
MPTLKRILIVDDSPVVLAAAKHALEADGFAVETRSGVDEIGALGARGFDLILMDVQMPELYGDDVAVALRTQRDVATPIYLFSTLGDAELAVRAKEAQLEGYISKQGGMDHLRAEVRRILG